MHQQRKFAYFSSIIELMCRDLHCYCIQANSSGPGDSRVLHPRGQGAGSVYSALDREPVVVHAAQGYQAQDIDSQSISALFADF